MKIKDFTPFVGIHCETTATGTLLKNLGYELSEPMMFGLGEGLGYIFWNSKQLEFPFIGGRTKAGSLSRALAANLNLNYEVSETSSKSKAWSQVKQMIDDGVPIGLQLDSYFLEYFGIRIHFAGHFVAMYGYDDDYAYLVDTRPNGGKVKTSLDSLEKARSEKGPMAAKNLCYWLHGDNSKIDMGSAIRRAIANNTREYLNPPIKNLGYKGILKTSTELVKCCQGRADIKDQLKKMAILMEDAGTGGSIFRNMYRDFLAESYEITGLKILNDAHAAFQDIAGQWKEVINLIDHAGDTGDLKYIEQAGTLMTGLSQQEYDAMSLLSNLK